MSLPVPHEMRFAKKLVAVRMLHCARCRQLVPCVQYRFFQVVFLVVFPIPLGYRTDWQCCACSQAPAALKMRRRGWFHAIFAFVLLSLGTGIMLLPPPDDLVANGSFFQFLHRTAACAFVASACLVATFVLSRRKAARIDAERAAMGPVPFPECPICAGDSASSPDGNADACSKCGVTLLP